VILAARLGRPDREKVINAAMGVEFLHVATLIHDDVIDNSDLRRGKPSLQKRIGVDRAIIVGDHYLAQGLQCLSRLGDAAMVGRAAMSVMRICRGELTHVSLESTPQIAEQAYFEKVVAKTSALLEVCTSAGAVAGGLDPDQAQQLNTYARELGIAFQIVDDLLDYAGDESSLGKPVGSDLREGTITLPLLSALSHGDNGQRLRELVVKPALDALDIEQCVRLVRESPVLSDVWRQASDHAALAMASLTSFDPSPSRENLERLCEAVVAKR
jgi:heptaprenyl diphosphate synthase component 2